MVPQPILVPQPTSVPPTHLGAPTKIGASTHLGVLEAKHIKDANEAVCGVLDSAVEYAHAFRGLGTASAHGAGVLGGRVASVMVLALVAGEEGERLVCKKVGVGGI